MKRATTLKPPATTSAKHADPDNPPWSEEMLGPAVVRHGRGPQKAPRKVLTSIRLDADVLAYFRALGSGYQSRINKALRDVVEHGLTTRSAATHRRGFNPAVVAGYLSPRVKRG
ncbi:MAG: BrnA antitoxin family protein [Casimicrobiaceae bacterium]